MPDILAKLDEGINRYIMECKSDPVQVECIPIGICELIDTLWNVNSFVRTVRALAFPELIDTLWNVNSKVFDEQVGQNMN